jgi:hypothetical protein
MKFELINTLSESRMFRTVDALGRYDSKTKNILLYACLLSAIALSLDEKTTRWGRDYAGRTAAFGNFDFFRNTATDLYALAFDAQRREGNKFGVVERNVLTILKGLSRGSVDQSLVENTLLRLESALGISDSKLRSARRDIAHWGDVGPANRSRAINDLYRIIKSESAVAEVLPYLLLLTKGNVGGFGEPSALKKVAATAAAGLGALAAGMWHGWNSGPRKKWSLLDDKEQKDE